MTHVLCDREADGGEKKRVGEKDLSLHQRAGNTKSVVCLPSPFSFFPLPLSSVLPRSVPACGQEEEKKPDSILPAISKKSMSAEANTDSGVTPVAVPPGASGTGAEPSLSSSSLTTTPAQAIDLKRELMNQKIRNENRERKKRWREQNEDRSKSFPPSQSSFCSLTV